MPLPHHLGNAEGQMDQFANYQGDPNGNSSFAEEMAWAQKYLNEHPGWQGNGMIGVRNGQVFDNRAWIDRHGGQVAAIGSAAVAGLGGLAGAGLLGGAGAAGAGAPSIGATGGLGAGAFPTVAGTSGAAAIPSIGATGGLSAGAFPTIAGTSGGGGGIGAALKQILLGKGGGTGGGIFGSKGILGSLLSPQGLYAAGKGLGNTAEALAKNRGAKLSAMLASDQMKLAEQQQRMSDEAALPGKIHTADYLASGGYTPKPSVSSNGRSIPTFDLGLKPISENEKTAGATLYKQLTDRLNNPPTYNDYSSVMDAGTGESILNWISPVVTGIGAGSGGAGTDYTQALIQQILHPQGPAPTTQVPTAPPPTIQSTRPPIFPPPQYPTDGVDTSNR